MRKKNEEIKMKTKMKTTKMKKTKMNDTIIVRWKKGNEKIAFRLASSVVNSGGIIVYPTETAYGIGCNALDAKAVREIYKLKRRMKTKEMPVIVSSLSMIKNMQ